MNGIPAECEAIKTQLDELEGEKEDLQSQLPGLAGDKKWRVLQAIKRINDRIAATAERFNDCIRAFGPAYRVDVVVMDLTPGGSVLIPVTGHLWYISPTMGQRLVESVPAQNGTCTFVRSPVSPTSFVGLSVDEQGSPLFYGQLFRSGSMAALPTMSTGYSAPTVEVIVPSAVMIPASMVSAPASIPDLPLGVTLSGPPTITLNFNTITLIVTGIIAGTFVVFGFIPVAYTLAVTYTLTFNLTPSGDIKNPGRICAVVPAGPGSLTSNASGLMGMIFSALAPNIEPSITGTVVPNLEANINATILSHMSGAVPAGSIVSMRRIVITPAGLSLFPAVGRFLP